MLLKAIMPVFVAVLPEVVVLAVAQKFGCWHSLGSSSSKLGVPKPVTYVWITKSIKVRNEEEGDERDPIP